RSSVGRVIPYIVSFYNVEPAVDLGPALTNLFFSLACVGMYYLIVNNVRTDGHLRRVHLFQAISIGTIALFALYELEHPGTVIIPGWIVLGDVGSTAGVNLHDVRIGGPFFDFELLAEFTAINLFLLGFLAWRARSTAARVVLSGLTLTMFFILFATVTRGAVIAFGIGALYLLWTLRHRIRFVPLTIGAGVVVILAQTVNYLVSKYTYSGDLFGRLLDPESPRFVSGLSHARAELWTSAFSRMLEHPVIGPGPSYVTQRGVPPC